MENHQRYLWHLLVTACAAMLWISQPGMGLVVNENVEYVLSA
jgi:hypothetical protein